MRLSDYKIPFNKPYFTDKEQEYIQDAVRRGHISGNGYYTKLCQRFFEERYGFKKCLLTTSCTDALEMAAILCDIQPGDEVIMPSFTFVSTANAFILRGAKILFVDSRMDHPGMDEDAVEQLITSKTKAIVPVHYAGVACDMDKIMALAEKHNLLVVEDAAQAIESYYNGKPLGGIGHLAAFSFHETKNISSGEGGMLVINHERFLKRAEIIWEKGTNRAAFFRDEIDKYGWIDLGSSFLPSDLIAAVLWAQLECIDEIQKKRNEIWEFYNQNLYYLEEKGKVRLPKIPRYATNNANMFYLVMNTMEERDLLIQKLKEEGILAVFHYQALHNSHFFLQQPSASDYQHLTNCIEYTNKLLRLPFYIGLMNDINNITLNIHLDDFKV